MFKCLLSLINKKQPQKKVEKEKVSSKGETMYKYSKSSLKKLHTCHPDIQKLLKRAIKHYDITIIEGVRSLEKQKENVRTGVSQTMDSKHLEQKDGYSWACDCALYPINWEDRDRFVFLQGYLKGLSDAMYEAGEISHRIRCGVDWDGDGNIKEHSLFDGPHIELLLE